VTTKKKKKQKKTKNKEGLYERKPLKKKTNRRKMLLPIDRS
jgi:hypothetical protein